VARPVRRVLRNAAVMAGVAACLAGAAGCGSDELPPQLTTGQRADLHTLVGQARTAAGAGDLAATRTALEQFEARVRTLRDSGSLTDGGADELLKHAALAELKARRTIAATTPPPADPAATPPPVTQPAPAVTPPPPVGGGAKPKAKGKGNGKAKGKNKPGKQDG